jgi:predicted  nucleic acid-binding Zn-ribbon protein
MRVFGPLSIILLTAVTAGCATAVDMDAVNRRLNENTKRIEALEKSQARQQAGDQSSTAKKVDSLQKELESLQQKFADSNWTVGQLAEKVESLKALMEEIQLSMAQFRRKGGEIDKALEEITNRLEADVRTLADKLRQMLESDSGN